MLGRGMGREGTIVACSWDELRLSCLIWEAACVLFFSMGNLWEYGEEKVTVTLWLVEECAYGPLREPFNTLYPRVYPLRS